MFPFVLLCTFFLLPEGLETDLLAFDPAHSTTFGSKSAEWSMRFADGSHLRGYVVNDVVHLGSAATDRKFQWALIRTVKEQETEWAALRRNGVSGILGIGYPRNTSVIREKPIFYWLKDKHGKKLPHMFSIFMTAKQDELKKDQDGALVLGGYDTTYYSPPRFWTSIEMSANKAGCETRLDCGYWMAVRQIYFGSTEKDPKDHSALLTLGKNVDHILALPDTGTTCLSLPKGVTEQIINQPFEEFMQLHSPGGYNGLDPKSAFYIEVLDTNRESRRIEIPLKDYVLRFSEKECITASPDSMPNILILGAPLFRAVQMVFDMTDDGHHKIGISVRRTEGHPAEAAPSNAIVLPLQTTEDENYYSTTVQFGTPAQGDLELIVDTGSSIVAAFEISNGGLKGKKVFPQWLKYFIGASSGAVALGLLVLAARRASHSHKCAAIYQAIVGAYRPVVNEDEDDNNHFESPNENIASSDEDIL